MPQRFLQTIGKHFSPIDTRCTHSSTYTSHTSSTYTSHTSYMYTSHTSSTYTNHTSTWHLPESNRAHRVGRYHPFHFQFRPLVWSSVGQRLDIKQAKYLAASHHLALYVTEAYASSLLYHYIYTSSHQQFFITLFPHLDVIAKCLHASSCSAHIHTSLQLRPHTHASTAPPTYTRVYNSAHIHDVITSGCGTQCGRS